MAGSGVGTVATMGAGDGRVGVGGLTAGAIRLEAARTQAGTTRANNPATAMDERLTMIFESHQNKRGIDRFGSIRFIVNGCHRQITGREQTIPFAERRQEMSQIVKG